MIKVDLITGFLGAGKTTFLKRYARYFMNQGIKVGILVNDYGAVNVDMLLLNELRGELCELEMVAGGCDSDCHRRRFKTKLISMAMSGYKRVIIEPSGLFDMDEFFDTLRESPLDNWYEIGSVITIVDANLDEKLSSLEEYMLQSQLGHAGISILSKTDRASRNQIEQTLSKVQEYSGQPVLTKAWDEFTEEDYRKMSNAGYRSCDYVKKSVEETDFETLYFLEHGLKEKDLLDKIPKLFQDASFGRVFRIKGFCLTEDKTWREVNATSGECNVKDIPVGQEVLIVIGEQLQEEQIRKELI